ncbi:MAG: hypothetical protein EBV02_04400 [Actinobacteria bacterium]|nr:hypothetical protein [Actinomycetota bacterium]
MAASSRIGLRGGTAIAHVDAAGFVTRDGRRATELGWWVAADDRWHDPREEPSGRQRLIDGTPVVETKIAVPGGDVVQRGSDEWSRHRRGGGAERTAWRRTAQRPNVAK